MDKWQGAELNKAKEILAFELTKLVHGEEEAKKAEESAKALFSGAGTLEMPTVTITEGDLRDGKIDILGILTVSGLTPSRSDARRAVEQGGVTVNDVKITDIRTLYAPEDLAGDGIVVRRGKKSYKRIKY